jgi:peptidyl-prolyl cis-trans isomerase D
MFDTVSKHKRIVQIVLALVSLPFAFFGVDYYFRSSGGTADDVAVFDGGKVTQAEFAQALRDQQEMLMRTQRNVDPALFDNPEVRFNILQQVLRERLLQKKAADLHFRVSDNQVFEQIASDPRFREGDKFSLDRYRELLAGAGISEARYEDGMRAQIMNERLVDPIARGGIVAQSTAQAFVTMLEQTREVAVATIDTAPFLKEANAAIDAAAVKAFYDANSSAFRTPEEVKFEYVVLTPDALLPQVSVTPEEVKAQYANNAKQYTKEEQREAAHILIAVKPDASEAEKAAAKKKAEEIYAKVKANPAQFAEIAKKESQDPGSAAQGGDLGSNPRGTMVKAFEDALWALKQPGDIAAPVHTEFGWHVIKLLGITPAQTRSFDEAKAQIEADLKRQKVSQKFAQAADQFQNLVYEQADSLAGAAKALDLKVQTSPLVTRADVQRLAFGNAKFVQALFSPESLNGKRNTDAMEVGPNTLMAGRVLEYKPAAPRPFDEVKEEIRRQLAQRAASERAQKEGREKLALLESGKSDKDAGVTFGKAVTLTRSQVQPGFPPEALARVFQADAAKLPQYVGSPTERGFAIYRIVKVSSPPAADPVKLAGAQSRVADLQNREIFDAYVAALKAKADVKINQANLEKK